VHGLPSESVAASAVAMGGGGRPRSADAERGTVVVDGTMYEYAAHTNNDPSRWRLYFSEPGPPGYLL